MSDSFSKWKCSSCNNANEFYHLTCQVCLYERVYKSRPPPPSSSSSSSSIPKNRKRLRRLSSSEEGDDEEEEIEEDDVTVILDTNTNTSVGFPEYDGIVFEEEDFEYIPLLPHPPPPPSPPSLGLYTSPLLQPLSYSYSCLDQTHPEWATQCIWKCLICSKQNRSLSVSEINRLEICISCLNYRHVYECDKCHIRMYTVDKCCVICKKMFTTNHVKDHEPNDVIVGSIHITREKDRTYRKEIDKIKKEESLLWNYKSPFPSSDHPFLQRSKGESRIC
jgi:hypothetical protein